MTSLPSRPAPRSFRERRLEQIAAELGEHADRVRERLSLADVVSLAIRAHRRQLGLSQRGYAAARGYSASHVARLERSAGDLRLAAVVDALRSSGLARTMPSLLALPRRKKWCRRSGLSPLTLSRR